MLLDFHSHYSHRFFRYQDYTMEIEDTVGLMDRHGVGRAVLSCAGEYAAILNGAGNGQIADAVRRYPDRFIGFATINPWWRGAGLEELRRCRDEFGFAGLVLHPILQGFEANDPLVLPLVEAAVAKQMIVYVTGGAPYLAMPYKIADLAGRFPEGRFVMGHAGWDFHFDVPYCLEAHRNLWVETSRNGLANTEALVRKFGAGRLLFGSDHPFSSYEAEVEKIRLLPGLTDVDREMIFHGNAQRLLGLENGE